MARIEEIADRNQLAESDRVIWDEIELSRGSVRGPFKVLLQRPELARRIAHLGTHVRFEGTLDAYVRELSVLVTCGLLRCDYEWSAHEKLVREHGGTDETVNAVRDRRPDGLSADDRIVYQVVQEILEAHRITESTFTSARQRFGDAQLVELIVTVGYYALLACVLNGFEVQP
jgi:4-carboxymuconolactone decarboxylase